MTEKSRQSILLYRSSASKQNVLFSHDRMRQLQSGKATQILFGEPTGVHLDGVERRRRRAVDAGAVVGFHALHVDEKALRIEKGDIKGG